MTTSTGESVCVCVEGSGGLKRVEGGRWGDCVWWEGGGLLHQCFECCSSLGVQGKLIRIHEMKPTAYVKGLPSLQEVGFWAINSYL